MAFFTKIPSKGVMDIFCCILLHVIYVKYCVLNIYEDSKFGLFKDFVVRV